MAPVHDHGELVVMNKPHVEPWLRGEIPDVPPLLQPVAHALIHSLENITSSVQDLSKEQMWQSVGGCASVGFHLRHLAGSTDRLMTYARGEELSEVQRAQLGNESETSPNKPDINTLLSNWNSVVEASIKQLAATSEARLTNARFVGRARMPSTVLGLLFHAAEHAARHTGQIVTTAKLVRQAL